MKDLITIVVPCYNEEKALPLYYEKMRETMQKMDYADFELILVNDGSKDKTLEVIKALVKNDNRIKYISFSRNFGKEAAMFAGFEYARGNYIAIMDADLQDPPELLEEMYKGINEEGYDCVATKRVSRKGEPKLRSIFSKVFYKLINKMSKTEMVDGARDFRLMTRQMLKAIIDMKEYNRYSKGIFSFVGFDIKWIKYKNVERVAGKTHWSLWKLFKYALEAITSFSTIPLTLASFIGILFFCIYILVIIYIIISTLIFGNATSGWPSIICVIFMVTGIQLFCIGIIGQYLSKIYLEVKSRPIYIVKDTNIE